MKILLLLSLYITSLFSSTEGSKRVKVLFKEFDSKLAIEFQHDKKWHTYWKNPGDSGLKTEFEFLVNEKKVENNVWGWPAPKKFLESGDIWAYGYKDNISFFSNLPKLEENDSLKIIIKWLVCKDICIPGKQVFNFVFQSNKLQIPDQFQSNLTQTNISKLISKLPKKKDTNINYKLVLENKKLYIHFKLEDGAILPESDNLFITYPNELYSIGHEKVFKEGKSLTGYLPLEWNGEYLEPEVALPSLGKLEKPLIIKNLVFGQNEDVIIHESVLDEVFNSPKTSDYKKTSKKNDQSFIWILLLAFIGGLILNLMPCVLPVISLKLFGIIKYQNKSKAQILRHNGLYSLGVISSLLLLALIIILLKSTGVSVGWGFQLQSPLFVASIIIVLFIMSLNLFGLFEFKTPGGNKLGGLEIKEGPIGDFLSGVLATILSTPCSAPFLGSALAYSLSSSTIETFITFFSIGLGLSFPFLLTMVFPKLLSFFPRPGNWMNTLKYFLGASLILTIFWLLDVLIALSSINNILYFFLPALLFIFLSFFIFDKKTSNKITKSFVVMMSLVFISTFLTKTLSKNKSEIIWEKWSIEAQTNLINKNEIAFIDFTAKWCLTCQVNKKLILNTDNFQDFVKNKNIKLLRADWTKHDEKITSFLNSYNIAAVPAYFIIKNGNIKFIGETLSFQKILKEFEL